MNGERSDTARHVDDMPIFLYFLYQMGRNRGVVANDPIVFAGQALVSLVAYLRSCGFMDA